MFDLNKIKYFPDCNLYFMKIIKDEDYMTFGPTRVKFTFDNIIIADIKFKIIITGIDNFKIEDATLSLYDKNNNNIFVDKRIVNSIDEGIELLKTLINSAINTKQQEKMKEFSYYIKNINDIIFNIQKKEVINNERIE